VQADATVQVEDALRGDGQLGAQAGVVRIGVGDEPTESVVAAFELKQDERSGGAARAV
jgi:hypothetical protein